MRRRLSWYSPVTDNALFVNQRGQRVGEQSLDSVARHAGARPGADRHRRHAAAWSTAPGRPRSTRCAASPAAAGRPGDDAETAAAMRRRHVIDEFRRARRRKVADTILVTDAMTDSVIGRIGNLSETGMLLIASAPLVEDALYQLRFHLHDTRGRESAFEVGAHLLWLDRASAPGPGLDRLPLHHRARRPGRAAAPLDRRARRAVRVMPTRHHDDRADAASSASADAADRARIYLLRAVRVRWYSTGSGRCRRESLAVVDAELAQRLDDAVAGDPFGDHVQPALVADLGDRVDDRAAHRVGRPGRG